MVKKKEEKNINKKGSENKKKKKKEMTEILGHQEWRKRKEKYKYTAKYNKVFFASQAFKIIFDIWKQHLFYKGSEYV